MSEMNALWYSAVSFLSHLNAYMLSQTDLVHSLSSLMLGKSPNQPTAMTTSY